MRNRIKIVGDIVEIYLPSGEVTLIDLVDLEKVHNYTTSSWKAVRKDNDTTTYVKAVINGRYKSLHRVILDEPIGKVVDHEDRNGLNNCRSNLRAVSVLENTRNSITCISNKSGCPGVSYNKRDKTWRAYIKIKGKKIHLGQSKVLAEAIEMRKKGEEKYWGFRTNTDGTPFI